MQAITLIRSDTQSCMNIIVACTGIWINILTMAGYFAVMIYSSKWFGIISSISFTILMAAIFFFYQNRIRAYGERARMYAIKANAQVTIAYGNFKEMKIAGDSSSMLQKYQNVGQGYTWAQKEFQYKKSSDAAHSAARSSAFPLRILIFSLGTSTWSKKFLAMKEW